MLYSADSLNGVTQTVLFSPFMAFLVTLVSAYKQCKLQVHVCFSSRRSHNPVILDGFSDLCSTATPDIVAQLFNPCWAFAQMLGKNHCLSH